MKRTISTGRVLITLAVLASVACGSESAGTNGTSDGALQAQAVAEDVVTATLGIISTNIETAVATEAFEPAVEGQSLTVGDQVRTDETGFAELTYHDGSWMRIESEATLTLEELVDDDEAQRVRTSIDTGDAWNRVRDLAGPEDAYELDTPVATAAVRGTAFAASCEGSTRCTFSVLVGEVEIIPADGSASVLLGAGESLTVVADEDVPEPTEPGIVELSRVPFIARNLELDRSADASLEPSEEQAAGPDIWEITRFVAVPYLSDLPEDVVECMGDDGPLMGRLNARAAADPDGWPILEGDDLHLALLVAMRCGGTESLLGIWTEGPPPAGVGPCVADRFRNEPAERLAPLIAGVDPQQQWTEEDPNQVVADAGAACAPASPDPGPTATAPPPTSPPPPPPAEPGVPTDGGNYMTAIG